MGLVSIGLFATHQQALATDPDVVLGTGEAIAGTAEGACVATSPGAAVCPPTGLKNNLKTVGEKIVSPVFRVALIQALLNLSQFVLNRLAYEAAVAIASGGIGQESMFYKTEPADAFAQLGLEVAGEAVGLLSDLSSEELGVEFNLCNPGENKPILGLALAIGIKQKYQPEEPKCDILEVGANWEGFISDAVTTITDPEARQEAILGKFAESLKPGKNELSASLRLNIAINQKVHEQKMLQFLQRNESDYKNVTDFITGNVKTPSETLQKDFENKLEEVNGDQSQINVGELVNAKELIGGLALTTASTFANTLLSTLMNRVYTGLFDEDGYEFDPFDVEGVSSAGREAAQERFSDVLATNPIRTVEYNALSEFVVCVSEGVMNRGINNCVMDSNFLAAVSRGNSGAAMTVQEAIDEGLINGDWVLIGPDETASNQDPYCYTYGLCYGNLVKLRKARVIPIGWELAALRNGDGDATLQDVINGFDTCTEDGDIGPAGSNTQWCHLIDPNWVLKYPDSQCRALTNGELRIGSLAAGRQTYCADAPSCIGEDNDGNCTDGYGYCVEEKNTWRFRGNECPAEYASCLSFNNVETGDAVDYLVNTVDYSVCGQDNAGCRWYRTQKFYEDAGTAEDTSDDEYVWLPDGETYTTADHDDDWAYQNTSGDVEARASYTYTSDSGESYSYDSYAYEDRIYLTHDAEECADTDGGCTQLVEFSDTLTLNTVKNASFEEDADGDTRPDEWLFDTVGSGEILEGDAQYGSNSFSGNGDVFKQFISVSGNNFYTVSVKARADNLSATSSTIELTSLDEDGDPISISGLSYSTANTYCGIDGDAYTLTLDPSIDDLSGGDWVTFDCAVTIPEGAVQVELLIDINEITLDGVQLELGEDVSTFTEGYSTSTSTVYYKVAPDYLGCTGGADDPVECDDFAQVCSAQEVGCSLYTPEDGDPSVPAIISELDECPSECVGYTTYKQEATDREAESFPLYFIADSAATCSEQYVGCDAFTSLGAVAEGGEQTEYFTDTRSCLTETIADGSAANNMPATFFTWEGSDNEGYQLNTWYLLESNYTGANDTFNLSSTGSGFQETDPENAPCVHVNMTAEDEVVCNDRNALMNQNVWSNDDCDEHDDIFENPDCREYFDSEGNVHYRLHSSTISVDNACTPYRMDDSNETDCEDSGGYWTDQGFCRYYVLAEESVECPAGQSGCREYTGGSGRNATDILDETFEGGTYEDFVIADTSGTQSLAISNESVATDGHSLSVTNTTGTAGFDIVQIYLDSTDTSATYDADDDTTCTSVGGTVEDTGCYVENDVDGDGTADESCIISDGEESCGPLTSELVGGKTFIVDFWAKGSGELTVNFIEEGGTGDEHDMNDPLAETSGADPVTLSGSWQLYSLGPLDTSEFDDFDENAILRFTTDSSDEFYIDNITLKQTEENVTVIKDSWVVPSTCDQTPAGADSDQFYLGCEAYTDHKGNDADLYQFTNICNEKVIGCEGLYNTHNSESEYAQVFNARCVYTADASDDLTDGEVVSSNTDCEYEGETLCTITAGTSYCTFNAEQTFELPLPIESGFGIVYGPETRVVRSDTPVYLVLSDDVECLASAMGCTEVGSPTYNQTQTEVTGFESEYYIDLPASYDNILCDHQALFCEEWSSNESGNFYFKDPLDKSCEYKTGVALDNQSYDGWFRTGTEEPCYWTDDDGDGEFDVNEDSFIIEGGDTFKVWQNGDGDYDGWVAQCDPTYDMCTEFVDVVDTSATYSYGTSYYFTDDELLDEETLADTQKCEGQVSQKMGCGLFYNTTNSDLSHNASASYVTSVHADTFYGESPNSLVDPITCDVEGAAVFSISEADAQYYGVEDGLGSGLEDTVDLCMRRCVYEVESGDAIDTASSQAYTETGFSDTYVERSCLGDTDCPIVTTTDGEEVSGVCANVWEVGAATGDDSLDTADYDDEDMETYRLSNDVNEVLKVNRDRTCSSWLACDSSKTSWNSETSQYDRICDSIDLCVAGKVQGDEAICTDWESRDVEILTIADYASRDVTWGGSEFSGNTIPNQLPIEHYNQFNIEAEAFCQSTAGNVILNDNYLPSACNAFTDCEVDDSSATVPSCNTDLECIDANYGGCDCVDENGDGVCESGTGYCHYDCANTTETDYRLVYNAGACDSTEPIDDDGDGEIDRGGVGNGGECRVGFCGGDGVSCSDNDDCSDEACVVGYCQATGDTCPSGDCSCNPDLYEEADGTTHSDCIGVTAGGVVPTPICDPRQYVCVDVLTSDVDNREACVATDDEDGDGEEACGSQQECVPASTSVVGTCFNNSCLTDITDRDGNGLADALNVDNARAQSCRGYPEIDSPFPTDVVYDWVKYSDGNIDDDGEMPSTTLFELPQGTSNLDQSSLPYTYLSGFQDATVCALDNDGNPTDCLCSYDKVEYGSGAAYQYHPSGSSFPQGEDDEVPLGVCTGGNFSGIACINDDDCSTADKAGTCEFATQISTMSGWHGYCIERDTSIQTLGSSDTEDQACLSWLPVDQLTGATDLYAKYTSAGYAPQDTYYCADIAMGYGVGTTSIACAEVQDLNCNGGGTFADFKAEASNMASGSGEDDCIAAAWCPDGYFGIMTGCGGQSWDNRCTESAENDCPYFCVPKLSYKTNTSDGHTGERCLTPDDALDMTFNFSGEESAYSYFINNVGDHWSRESGYEDYVTSAQVYVMNSSKFDEAWSYYNDCFTRGVLSPDQEGGNLDEFYSPLGSLGDLPERIDTGGANDRGFYELIFDFRPRAVCTSLAQVSTKTLADNEFLPFKTYNAAYTDRLWATGSDRYTISSGDSYFNYSNTTEYAQFGKADDYQNLSALVDPYPHEAVMCESDEYAQEPAPADVGASCDTPTEFGISSSSGADARAFYEVSITVDGSVYSEWCKDGEDCLCYDNDDYGSTDPSECNWNNNNNRAITCGGVDLEGICDGGSNDGADCTLYDYDNSGDHNDCGSGYDCIGVCDGGPYHGGGDVDEDGVNDNYCYVDSDCTLNSCVPRTDGDNLTGAACYARDDAPEHSLIPGGDEEDAIANLSQIFGRIYGLAVFSDDGYDGAADVGTGSLDSHFSSYEPFGSWELLGFDELNEEGYGDWIWNNLYDTDGEAPHIAAVGDCNGSECFEGAEDSFTVDEQTGGEISAEGSYRAPVSFYAYADTNHMPIRRMVVDWGDDFTSITGDIAWGTGSQSGSTADDNFYKNYRGINPISNQDECQDGTAANDEFGNSADACSSSYVTFTHDYVCTQGRLNDLQEAGRTCDFEDDGRLVNSPCVENEACVFQPRIHVMDNWGWCTGYCDSEETDTGTECFTGVLSDGSELDECNIDGCPGGGSGSCEAENLFFDGDLSNPWINWAGYISVTPE